MPDLIVHKQRRLRPLSIILIVAAVFILGMVGGALYMNFSYKDDLKPFSSEAQGIRVTIEPGTDGATIGKLLEEKKVIRSAKAFQKYLDSSNTKNKLQAGSYLLSANKSVQEIVDILVGGKVDDFNFTLVPGKRLDQIATSLQKVGFEKAAIDSALKKNYSHPLLVDKPASADLEGYIFPDTYNLNSASTPESTITTTFDVFYKKIQDEGLIDKLKAQKLNLFQAITLASIVQQEVPDYATQQIVAQVFLRRLREDMPLGADPTFRYASYKAGVDDYINIDSPYNTRLYKGLPPGPIGNFNISALKAVANPATTNYLYFVAGDDGITRFSNTQAEHESLTAKYCIKLCQL